MGWLYPSQLIEKDQDVREIDDLYLDYYHEQMHVFWAQIESGTDFGWTFTEVLTKHTEVLNEMAKRNIRHFSPINSLDIVVPEKLRYVKTGGKKLELLKENTKSIKLISISDKLKK